MVRYPLSLLTGLGITVAMLWLIWGLTSYQPQDRQLPQRVMRLPIAPAMPAAELPKPQRPPTELPPPPPIPEALPPPPPKQAEPPLPDPIEPLLPEPDLSLDLPGRPLLGPKPRPRPKPIRRPSRTASPSPAATSRWPANTNQQPVIADRQPAILSNPRPTYPRRARMRHQQGAVKLRFTVTAAGKVRDIQVVWSRPAGVFDREAKRALARWRFKPALTDGQVVSAQVSQVIHFKLER